MTDVLDLQEPMLDGGIRAVNFFTGRLLTGKDFGREQDARRTGDARLGLATGDGVVAGLEVETAPAKATAAQPVVVRVFAGQGLNACGQTLCLRDDAYVALTQQAAATAVDGALFGACNQVATGTYVSGAGVYILTIAPAQASEGTAATNGLDPFNVRCNTDATVEALQFRLLAVPPTWYAALDRTSPQFRSRLAALFLGNAEVDALLGQAQPPATWKHGDSGAALGVADLPLAVLYYAGNAVQFIDNHMVRRGVARASTTNGWGALPDARRRVEGEAAFLDFQEQLEAVAKPLASTKAVKATDRFAWLPAAGILPIGAGRFDWPTFLGTAAASTAAVDLDRGLVRAVLDHSFTREPVALDGAAAHRLHVYRVVGAGVASPYVVFARTALAEVIAADVAFDNRVCKLPNADNVQTAIEELWKIARCACSIVVAPGAGWEKAFDQIPDGADAEVCFQAGDYPLTQPLRIANKRYLKISGAGPGTRIHADKGETALAFDHCTGVFISSLGVSAGVVGGGDRAAHVGGALTLSGCAQVDLDHLTLACAGDAGSGNALSRRTSSCLTVANTAGPSAGTVRVRACTLLVGRQQIGMQLVNVGRAQIEDNVLAVGASATPTWQALDTNYRADLLRNLFADAKAVTQRVVAAPAAAPKAAQPAAASTTAAATASVDEVAAPKASPSKKAAAPVKGKASGAVASKRKKSAGATRDEPKAATTTAPLPARATALPAAKAPAAALATDIVRVDYQGVAVTFRTTPALARPVTITLPNGSKTTTNAWQQLIDQAKPVGLTTPALLSTALGRVAETIMADGKAVGFSGVAVDKFAGVVNTVLAQEVPAGAQAIVIAGQQADEVRIVDNTIDGFVQGIHVAISQRDLTAPTKVLQAGNVAIRGNTIRVALPSSATRERHGIFVGNCASLAIRDNRISATRSTATAALRIEGIRVFGAIGRRLLVDRNHLTGFTIGLRFWPTNRPTNAETRMLWIVAENVFEGATTMVQIEPRPRKPPLPPPVPPLPPLPPVEGFVTGLATNIS